MDFLRSWMYRINLETMLHVHFRVSPAQELIPSIVGEGGVKTVLIRRMSFFMSDSIALFFSRMKRSG